MSILTKDDNPWTAFGEGRWVKSVPTEPGRYLVRFGHVLPIEVFERGGELVAYHHKLGHRNAEDVFSNKWRWSVPMPDLPPVPR